MVKFGPSNIDELFYKEGFSSFVQMPEWITKRFGLHIAEYPFNLGINVSDDTAKAIGEQAKKWNVEITAHAPYYINYANPLPEFELKSNAYIVNSLKKLKLMGGRRLVVHLGTQGKEKNRQALLNLIRTRLEGLPKILDDNGLTNVMVCFETMGKYSQIGSYEEIAPLTNIDKRFNLTLDFGHINCTQQGALQSEEDFEKIFNHLLSVMPREKVENIHIHFSHIEFNDKGEVRHHFLDEEGYGPPFEPLAKVIKKLKLSPFVICESRSIMAQDAYKLKTIYEKI